METQKDDKKIIKEDVKEDALRQHSKDNMTDREKRLQERKKLDEETTKQWNLKKEKIKQDKAKAKELFQKALLEPRIKNNLIVWVDKNKNGSVYEGSFGKEKCFEIKRGVLMFSLKTIHKELNVHTRNNNSTELFKLQEKANKILWNNPEFLRKFKPVS
jgi:hypothetical protein